LLSPYHSETNPKKGINFPFHEQIDGGVVLQTKGLEKFGVRGIDFWVAQRVSKNRIAFEQLGMVRSRENRGVLQKVWLGPLTFKVVWSSAKSR